MANRNAFTLVELVVVVLLLGILAGVAAPKLFSTTAIATDNGLRQTLASVRDAIDLYAAQNGGNFPPCSGTGSDFHAGLATHLRGAFPRCPVGPAKNVNVLAVGGASTDGEAAPTSGWKFNTETGVFICNFSGASVSDGAVTYDKF